MCFVIVKIEQEFYRYTLEQYNFQSCFAAFSDQIRHVDQVHSAFKCCLTLSIMTIYLYLSLSLSLTV